MRIQTVVSTALLAVTFFCRPAAGQICCLRGDTDGDFKVSGADIQAFVQTVLLPGSIGPQADCGSDTNQDFLIDMQDVPPFIEILLDPSLAMPIQYDPPRPDPIAEAIAFEMLGPDGPYTLPDEVYNRVVQDIPALIAHVDFLVGQGQLPSGIGDQPHTPIYVEDEILIVTDPAFADGTLECLNAQFGVIDVQRICCHPPGEFPEIFVIKFPGKINAWAASKTYQDVAIETTSGEPNCTIGPIADRNNWSPVDIGGGLWEWTITDGEQDCLGDCFSSGCDCLKIFKLQTNADASEVTLVSYEQMGQPWCDF